jgi:type I restriction enzyme M protein
MKLTQQQLEAHLWGAANILRGKTAGQDYKNYILSLMFYKRLCDQWENEADETIAEQERLTGRAFTEQQKAIFRATNVHRFTIPDGARWGDVLAVSTEIGAKLTEAMRAVSGANDEMRGVFTVDWNQPAPDASGKKLIPNEVVHALVQHFDEVDLSKEFFTPPEVVDTLVRILEPRPGDTIYDPTCGSGGMLIHSADFLREQGQIVTTASYFGQEMNWGNFAIGKINSVLHGLEAKIEGGASTITDPQFLEHGGVKKFSLIMANFPFSDEFWWLKPEQQTDDKKKRDKLKAEVFGKDGYRDTYHRFGKGTPFNAPPAGYGDYAFILHILNSLNATGRAGVVCPQGVLFRGQPEVEEETGEFNAKGEPIIKRRKADDEHLIRQALLDSRLIDAVISLPLNVFYGAGVPACLLILRKERPDTRRDHVLLVYAARHFRDLGSSQNQLHPHDVMRMLVHYHAYGDASKVAGLVTSHSGRLRDDITRAETEEVERLQAEYAPWRDTADKLKGEIAAACAELEITEGKAELKALDTKRLKLEKQRERPLAKLAERDEKIAETRRRSEDDRQAVDAVGAELIALYADPDSLLKHSRVVQLDEIQENEYNLNIPRYVDTFEPEPRLEVKDAIAALRQSEQAVKQAEDELSKLLAGIGYTDSGC